ncbi:NUDIX hydrolase [Brevibacterium iodinum]|uniref:NUDIX hydrolase n=1 Tax=Brevibacterium iodinum TaxID=31943 RepID=UPI001ABF8C70|nr:NUDIX domain-containing protein [Brevibacterium iodinum]
MRVEAQADEVERFVVGAVVHHRGAVLIVRHNDLDEFFPGIEELPSGGVEAGETLAEALDRELLEEVGFGAGGIDCDFRIGSEQLRQAH